MLTSGYLRDKIQRVVSTIACRYNHRLHFRRVIVKKKKIFCVGIKKRGNKTGPEFKVDDVHSLEMRLTPRKSDRCQEMSVTQAHDKIFFLLLFFGKQAYDVRAYSLK